MNNRKSHVFLWLVIKAALVLSSSLFLVSSSRAEYPTTNILQRVVAVRVDSLQGSAFTMEIDERQYLVTAGHLFADSMNVDEIQIRHDSVWRAISVELIAPITDTVDVAVFALTQQLTPSFTLEPTTGGMIFGQKAYFFGFPSMLSTPDKGKINRGFPLPFVKHAIISAERENQFGKRILYLDGHNNPGFSGGPVVFWDAEVSAFKLAGVIKGYRPERLHHQDSNRVYRPVELWGNSGIIVATEISAVVSIIQANPKGVKIRK